MMLRIALLFTIFCSALDGLAQEDYITSRWNFKLGYSRFPGSGLTNQGGVWVRNQIGQLLIETNYGVTPHVEVGTYLGFGRFQISPDPNPLNFRYDYTNTPFYGITANFHLLPFFLKKGIPRLDLFVGERFGGYYHFTKKGYAPERGHYFDFGIYTGTNYYIGKHFGIFGEYGLANGRQFTSATKEVNYRTYFRIGASLKF